MKRTTLNSAITVLTLLTTPLFGQGSLTPSQTPDHKSGPDAALDVGGLPQPTMKTLQQVEPRVDVQTLAGDVQTTYIIDQPGSYYLSQNILSDKDVGISIQASRVVLDLNGFHLSGADGREIGSKGIHVVSNVHAVTVRNGTVSLFKDGIAAFSTSLANPKACVFENLQATRCSEHGFLIGEDSVIRHCTSWSNGAGIHAENGTRISHCTVADCRGYGEGQSLGSGIFARNRCLISHCVVKDNKVRGILTHADCVIEHTTASGNTGQYGIAVGKGSALRHCTANDNIGTGSYSRGISLGQGCSAIACIANNNKGENDDSTSALGVGIFATSACLIKNCTVEGNDGDGIRIGLNNRVEENQCANNGAAGIRMTGDCNRVDSNHSVSNDYGIYYGNTTANVIIRNTCLKNTSSQLFVNSPGNTAPTDNIAVGATSDNPWVNFYLNN